MIKGTYFNFLIMYEISFRMDNIMIAKVSD